MFGQYLVTALRNIARHRLAAVINIGGLALGLACVIVVAVFVRDELSFDGWVPDSANVFRVEEGFNLPGRAPMRTALADFPLAQLMKDNLPEVTAITRVWPMSKTVTVDGRSFAQQIAEVDPDFFQVIRFPLAAGDPVAALSRPDAIVLSQALARKLFGTENVVGRTLAVNKTNCPTMVPIFEATSCENVAINLLVSGVMRDLPHNTHLQLDAFIPHTSPADAITDLGKKSYFSVNGFAYVRLAPGTDPARVLARIPDLLDRHVNMMEDLGMKLQASKTITVGLTPFAHVHLASADLLGNMVPPTSVTLLLADGLIGALILLVACFNFTNLATALAMGRTREIALRKVSGARRGQIVIQFLGESVLTAFLALFLALCLAEILLPAYGNFIGRPLGVRYGADWPLLFIIAAIAAAAGLLGGAYPALVTSQVRPAPVLRSGDAGHIGSSRLRTGLVVLQFAVAIGLGVTALVVFAQVDFAQHQSLGFRHDNILVINTNRRLTADARESLVAELGRHPGILEVARSFDAPFAPGTVVAQMKLPGQAEYITMERKPVTPQYFRLYDIPLLAGRQLSDARGEDRMKTQFPQGLFDGLNILVNRTAAARFGFTPSAAVGKTVIFGQSKVTIAGVVADTRLDGARGATRALIYTYDPVDAPTLSLRLAPGQAAQVTAFVDQTWRRFSPNVAIERSFLDESFVQLYRDDEREGYMFAGLVAIAIAISCLGLFGLAAFTAGQRTREIGIRKTFGARAADLVRMLLWQFSRPVLMANLIAWPLAWYALRTYLNGFADRISLNPLYFAAAGIAALAIAWGTVFGHALRIARANPIHALRSE